MAQLSEGGIAYSCNKCSTKEQKSNLGWKASSKARKIGSSLLQTSNCLGAESLIKLLKNYTRSHEETAEAPPSSVSGHATGNNIIYDDDEPMASAEDEAAQVKVNTANSRQNKRLYTEEGMLNTKLRKAEKKKRKNETNPLMVEEENMDGDYDFKVDLCQTRY